MRQTVKKTNKKRLKIFAIVLIGFIFISTVMCLIFIDNKNIQYDYYELTNNTTKNKTIKVIHLSDLHSPKIKVDLDQMIEKIQDEKPHIIVITGDLIDGSAIAGTSGVYDFMFKLKNVAPIYYVDGNHENMNIENMVKLKNTLMAKGITILSNESVQIALDGVEVTIIGLADNADYDKQIIEKYIHAKTNYKILLAHRPEKWENYTSLEKECRPNLILTGHAHGGQFRVFGQGLIAPNQGLFPKYDSGIYKLADGNCSMIVSRGIGNSIIPFRFNNKPHVPIIEIKV